MDIDFKTGLVRKLTREELKDEFYQLRNDDKDFEAQYNEDEFEEWLKDNEIIL